MALHRAAPGRARRRPGPIAPPSNYTVELLNNWTKRTRVSRVAASAATLKARLTPIKDELIQVQATSRRQLRCRPDTAGVEVFASLRDRVDQQLEGLDGVVNSDIAVFNGLRREVNVPGVVPLSV